VNAGKTPLRRYYSSPFAFPVLAFPALVLAISAFRVSAAVRICGVVLLAPLADAAVEGGLYHRNAGLRTLLPLTS
jgi:hypothetical protein